MEQEHSSKPWYKEPWPWILMSGPAIVVVAAFVTLNIAMKSNSDLVTDDYYKDGKHINLDLHRDTEAAKRQIHAQVLISPDGNSAKVFLSGQIDVQTPIKLTLLHPAQKIHDQSVVLKRDEQALSGDKMAFSAVFKTLPATGHWYVRLEDEANTWRVEDKWIVSQGLAVNLQPKSIAEETASSVKP